MKLYQSRFQNGRLAKNDIILSIGFTFWNLPTFIGFRIGFLFFSYILEFTKKDLPRSFAKDEAGKDVV